MSPETTSFEDFKKINDRLNNLLQEISTIFTDERTPESVLQMYRDAQRQPVNAQLSDEEWKLLYAEQPLKEKLPLKRKKEVTWAPSVEEIEKEKTKKQESQKQQELLLQKSLQELHRSLEHLQSRL